MGWGSGSSLLTDVWTTVRSHVSEERRVDLLTELMDLFASYDADTLDECIVDKWPESRPAYEGRS